MTHTRGGRWLGPALLVVSTGLAFAVGEILVRRWMPEPPTARGAGWIHDHALSGRRHDRDSVIGWVLPRDSVLSSHRSLAPDGSVIFDVTYQLGNGERATSLTRRDGPVVVCTGGSFTFGHGLPDDESWPWLLQDRLPTMHVVNVGSMAYGTDQALMAAERAITKYDTDSGVVALGFADFQVGRNESAQTWLVHLMPFEKPHYVLSTDTVECRGTVGFVHLGRMLGRSALLAHAFNRVVDRVRRVPAGEAGAELTARLIIGASRRLAARNVTLLVVVLPWRLDHTSGSRAERAYILDRLRAAEIPVLEPELDRRSDGSIDADTWWISRHDAHPNRAYNDRIAAAVAAWMSPR